MKRSKPMAAVAGIALLALAACGGGGDDGDSAGPKEFQDTTPPVEKVPDAEGPAPEIDGAQEGGTITVMHPDPDDGPDSLDPTPMWSVTDNGIMQALVFRSLTTFRYNPETGGMELVPDLATDLGTPNEDFTEWTFTIKDDVKWEDGTPVTADEVAFGLKRSMDSEALPGPGNVYSNGFFLGGDKYAGPYKSGENFEGISVSGQDVTIKMSKPFSEMDFWGTFAAMSPVKPGKASDPPGYGLDPLATGPYKVKSFTPNQEIVLERNDQWDPATDPARHQFVDEFVLKFDQNPETTDATMISDNEESQTMINTILSGSKFQEASAALGDQVRVDPQTCTSFLAMQYQGPNAIDDINIRRAIAFAYDYENVWAAAGEIPGTTRIMGNAYLPKGMLGYDEALEPIPGETVEYNPEKAKEYLAKAGIQPGEYELRWAYDDTTQEGKDAMEQVRNGYEEAGFKTKPFPYSGGSLYDVWTDPDNNIHKKLNLQGTAWCQDWPSAATFLPPLFQTDEFYNTGEFSEKTIDDMMAAVPDMPIEEQPAAWEEIDKTLNQEYYPNVNLGYYNNLQAYGGAIGNYTYDTVQGYPNLRDVYVTQ